MLRERCWRALCTYLPGTAEGLNQRHSEEIQSMGVMMQAFYWDCPQIEGVPFWLVGASPLPIDSSIDTHQSKVCADHQFVRSAAHNTLASVALSQPTRTRSR